MQKSLGGMAAHSIIRTGYSLRERASEATAPTLDQPTGEATADGTANATHDAPSEASTAPKPSGLLGNDPAPLAPAPLAPAPLAPASLAPAAAPAATFSARPGASSLATAEAALFDQEVLRCRAFLGRLAVVAIGCTFGFALGRGDTTARLVGGIAMVLLAITAGLMSRSIERDHASLLKATRAVGAVAIFAGLATVYYCGVLSLAAAGLLFCPLLVGMGSPGRDGMVLFVACAGGYALLAVAVVTGVLPEIGIVTARFPAPMRFIGPLALEAMLVGTFLGVRRQRSVALNSIADRLDAARSLAQREALLVEARQELERALHFAGLGRFSESSVGSFQLGKLLGRGSMGEVYGAVHKETGALAAVKLLPMSGLGSAEAIRRFLREAEIAKSLHVPNVVRVLEIGGLSSPLPFIAMERLQGEDLADHMRREGPMPFESVLRLVRHVGRGLEAARAAGIVHRDLKPRNIFVTQVAQGSGREPTYKILDFGVSKLADQDGTLTRGLVGSPGYMAPEQAGGGIVSHRSDLFSLGVIAYRALTGRPAFAGGSVAETIHKIASTMPPRPSDLVPAHPHVDLVFAVALAKDADDRFDSGAELAQALEQARAGKLPTDLVVRGTRLEAGLPWSRAFGSIPKTRAS